MKSNKFQTILDAYQLAEGAQIRAKRNPDEIFTLASYDISKKGYMVYPIDNGVSYHDFGVIITEKELMNDYEIKSVTIVTPKADVFAERKVA